ncbi:MAG: alginate export family protein [Aestuariibacter sp.]
MRTSRTILCLGILASIASSQGAARENNTEDSTLREALNETTVAMSLRYRLETVDQTGFEEDATANTLKGRLTAKTGAYGKWSGLIEFDYVADLFDEDFNSTVNGRSDFPVVADPSGADLNQFSLSYKATDSTMLTFGRQRIVHNNQRFVGGVAWRQNEQTFDAVRVQSTLTSSLKVDYAYSSRVNRIFGSSHPLGDVDGDLHLINGQYQFRENHRVTGYFYYLDFEQLAALSSQTMGVEYLFNSKSGLKLHVGYAAQQDVGDNTDYSANYFVLDGSIQFQPVTISAGYEVLGSDNGKAFTTPLATLHKFQGWADKFLATPADGIEDSWMSVSGKIDKLALSLAYHDYQSDEGDRDLGSEVNIVANYPFNKNVKLTAKYADYQADEHATDTRKFWLQLFAKY